jgi:hypothetical protein
MLATACGWGFAAARPAGEGTRARDDQAAQHRPKRGGHADRGAEGAERLRWDPVNDNWMVAAMAG